METRPLMAATRRTPVRSRGPLKGRALVAAGLVLFLAVSTSVVWRRSNGVRNNKQIQRLQDEKRSLMAQEKSLEGQLRRATSRRNVVQEAERRLGLVRPDEAQTRFISVPASGAKEP
jgi:cell division protein FtsB